VLVEGSCSLLVEMCRHCRQRGRRGIGDSFCLARQDVVSLQLEILWWCATYCIEQQGLVEFVK
jgi:hypothetical protein